MLTTIKIKGFKTLVDVALPLHPITVLVGPNNAGKTNILSAIKLIGDTFRQGSLPRALEVAGGESEVLTKGGNGFLELEVNGSFADTLVSYKVQPRAQVERLDLSGAFGGSIARNQQGQYPQWGGGGSSTGAFGSGFSRWLDDEPAPPGGPPFARQLREFFNGIAIADFSVAQLRSTSTPSNDSVLTRDGGELAAVLDRLEGERPDIRDRITEELRRVMPGVTKVITAPSGRRGEKVVGIAEGSRVFRAEHVSDGILLFIALTTMAQMSGGKTLVCVEEPEKGIHPRRIRDVIEQIHRVSRTGTQFVLTTHSPVLLDEFRDFPEQVMIVDRDDRGTKVTPLVGMKDVLSELRRVSLGELWFSGVLGGVPVK